MLRWRGPTQDRLFLEHNPSQKMASTTSTTITCIQVPSITLSQELVPSWFGHPAILLTRPIGGEETVTATVNVNELKETTQELNCSSNLFVATRTIGAEGGRVDKPLGQLDKVRV